MPGATSGKRAKRKTAVRSVEGRRLFELLGDVADEIEFVPSHCDPTINLYDRTCTMRGDLGGRLGGRRARLLAVARRLSRIGRRRTRWTRGPPG
jgi:hypothetical protein